MLALQFCGIAAAWSGCTAVVCSLPTKLFVKAPRGWSPDIDRYAGQLTGTTASCADGFAVTSHEADTACGIADPACSGWSIYLQLHPVTSVETQQQTWRSISNNPEHVMFCNVL